MKDTVMFCGKGGVGKTTCAAATALHYADAGLRTLIVSTDLTPSLRHIFELDNSATEEKPVEVSKGLYLDEIGHEEVKGLWEKRFGAEMYQVFSAFVDIDYPEFVDFISSILPGIRDEFMVDYIRILSEAGPYDKIVWDTAPAGQTLGLLKIPSVVNEHLKPAPRIYSALRSTKQARRSVLDVIRGWEELSAQDISFLRTQVEFNLVTIAEALAVRQLDSIIGELQSYGLEVSSIVVNQVITAADSDFLNSRAQMQQSYISEIRSMCGDNQRILPMFPYEMRGTARLKEVERALFRDGWDGRPDPP